MAIRRDYRDRQQIEPEDSKLAQYYRLFLTEEQMKLYFEFFKQELPSAFRLICHKPDQKFLANLEKLLFNQIDKQFLEQLPYPPSAFQFNCSRNELRKDKELNHIHKLTVLLHESNFISRQEYVSMLPPIFLNCQQNDKVLDMCAAPGSKTLQILEQVGFNGLVVANDLELKRCHTLMHQCSTKPSPQLIITNLDASRFPRFVAFDRILCDVPCSGDGTLRKSPDIWPKWSPSHALNLHTIQLKILIRGLQLLKTGGILSYSTCSLNVIENEAVVNAVCQILGNRIEIMDCSKQFTELKREPGLCNWTVYDNQFNVVTSPSAPKFPSSLFPTQNNESLSNCMRFYPWQQNSGGFFVCLIRKTKDFGDDINDSLYFNIEKNAQAYVDDNMKIPFKADMSRSLPIEPLVQLSNPAVVDSIQQYYQFDKLLDCDPHQMLSGAAMRVSKEVLPGRIYLLNKNVQQIMYSCQNAFHRYHIVTAGIATFEKQTGQNAEGIFRIEGVMSFLLPQSFTVTLPYGLFLEILMRGLTETSEVGGLSESLCFGAFPERYIQMIDEIKTIKVGLVLVRVSELVTEEENYVKSKFNVEICDSKVIVDFLNQLDINGWLGGNSLGFHVKLKVRNCIYALLTGQRVENIVVSGEAKRKAVHRAKRQRIFDEQKKQ